MSYEEMWNLFRGEERNFMQKRNKNYTIGSSSFSCKIDLQCKKLSQVTIEDDRATPKVELGKRQTYRTPQRGPDTSSKKYQQLTAEVSENWKFAISYGVQIII